MVHLLHSEVKLWAQDRSRARLLRGGQDLLCPRRYLIKVLLKALQLHLDFLYNRRRQQELITCKEKSQPVCYEEQITKGTFKILINLCWVCLCKDRPEAMHSLRSAGIWAAVEEGSQRAYNLCNSFRTDCIKTQDLKANAILCCIFILQTNTDCTSHSIFKQKRAERAGNLIPLSSFCNLNHCPYSPPYCMYSGTIGLNSVKPFQSTTELLTTMLWVFCLLKWFGH